VERKFLLADVIELRGRNTFLLHGRTAISSTSRESGHRSRISTFILNSIEA